jgi:hypothetical protein
MTLTNKSGKTISLNEVEAAEYAAISEVDGVDVARSRAFNRDLPCHRAAREAALAAQRAADAKSAIDAANAARFVVLTWTDTRTVQVSWCATWRQALRAWSNQPEYDIEFGRDTYYVAIYRCASARTTEDATDAWARIAPDAAPSREKTVTLERTCADFLRRQWAGAVVRVE